MERTVVTTFGKQKLISVSRPVAFILLLLVIGAVVGTGLVVHYLTASSHLSKLENSKFDQHNGKTSISNGVFPKETATSANPSPPTAFPNVTAKEESYSVKEENKNKTDLRLPSAVKPHSYNLEIIPFLTPGNFTFSGKVSILVNVTSNCKNVTLHASDLKIKFVEILTANQTQVSISNKSYDKQRQFLILDLNEELIEEHQYEIRIKYQGVLNDQLKGFYRSSYKHGNETRWIATTQFQPTDARRAFPCFDEPALKAHFKLRIARLKNMTAISNMDKVEKPPQKVDGLPDFLWDEFHESVPMSTYLVAFIVFDFQSISNNTFSIWARESALSQTKYSLEVGPKILKFYEEFFDIKYPLPKLDMVAIPDFAAGAMENWGLITYRETSLLYEESSSSKEALRRIGFVIAHELAHQWFGNLVTPTWWTDLWLNEGFATYVEYLGANAISDEKREFDHFVIAELQDSLSLDALKTSHPISVVVHDPDEINDIFDRISYAKGASIIRMMQEFLTMPVFRRGITSYLNSRLYGNADQNDLWASLTRQAHQDRALNANYTIKTIMDTWTLQTGFPLVTATFNATTRSILFSQEKFYITRNGTNKNESCLWWVPLTVAFRNDSEVKRAWMEASASFELENVTLNRGEDDWFLVNVNETGYYRVTYNSENWRAIVKGLNRKDGHLAFDVKNRAQLLDDVFNLAASGYLEYEIALNLSLYLVQEKEFVPWRAAISGLDYLYVMFRHTAHFDKFKKYYIKLMINIYEELGFEESVDDNQLTVYSRMQIYGRMCQLHLVRGCIIQTVQLFQNWKNSPNPDRKNSIPKNMRGITYCTAISVGSEDEWDFLWQRYLNSNVDNERMTILSALGCSKEIWILNRYLAWAINDTSGIRKQDSPRVFNAVALNAIGQQVAYRFLKSEWHKIKTFFGDSSSLFASVVRVSTMNFNTKVEIDDFQFFVSGRKSEFGMALRTANQAIEQGLANVQWMEKYFVKIVQWLSVAA